ncbi:MAG TPA: hypothetical protein VL463_06425 [Kofleriaceae bacterium]|nr:hypothetical protein [Kofleriaceae bacterium]
MTRALAALLVLTAACTNDVQVGQPLRRVLDVPPDRPGALDVLFVIDPGTSADAGAFFDELQTRLGDSLPDLHVGVISSELARNAQPAGCDGEHNGALRAGDGTCTANGARFLVDAASGNGLRVRNYDGAIGGAFACLADLPASTCSASQPMTALRVALGVDSLEGLPAANQGFLRNDAMLLVVVVSSRDDCSPDPLQPQFFSPGEFGSKPIAERCHDAQAKTDGPLVAPSAIADDVRALKRDPSMVMIAGVFAPPSGACASNAEPGVRLSVLMGELPSRYAYASICDGGPADQMRAIAHSVARVLGRSHCLLGPLPSHAACRAYAETDLEQRSIPRCDASTGGSCFTLGASDSCSDTATGLDAEPTPRSVPAGAHFVVECAAPPGL